MTEDEGLVAEVRRTEERWIEAYLGGDVAGFAELLTEDFVYTSERGVFDKRSYVRNLASGVIEMRGLRNDDHEVRLHGSTAISTGAATLDARYEGQDISGVGRFTRVWVKEDGSWRAALHANNAPREV